MGIDDRYPESVCTFYHDDRNFLISRGALLPSSVDKTPDFGASIPMAHEIELLVAYCNTAMK